MANTAHDNSQEERDDKFSQATQIVAFAQQFVSLFHDEKGDVYAHDLTTGENRRLQSHKFKDWLYAKYYRETGKTLREQSFREALSTLNGFGRYDSNCHAVFMRIAKFGGSYYLDLAQPGNSRAIAVSPGAWQIIDKPPVRFVRADMHKPLPTPTNDGDIRNLWRIVNVSEADRLLVLTWLIDTLRPDTPYPVLEMTGEQGSAKSTTQKALRQLVDPNASDLRGTPKCRDDLYVSAQASHMVSLENVSYLSDDLQDALCIIATGSGDGKRKHYSDAEEICLILKNPVMVNGISSVITRQDLIDRTVAIRLPTLEQRSDIDVLQLQFEQNKVEIFSGLIDLMAKALLYLPQVDLSGYSQNQKPRMIEFTRLGMAIAEASGYSRDKFLALYLANRQESMERTLEDSPVATAILAHMDNSPCSISGKLKDLIPLLERHRPTYSDGWPKSYRAFGETLRRLIPALRQRGIIVKANSKTGGKIIWEFILQDGNSTS
jgi:hypothetical protein